MPLPLVACVVRGCRQGAWFCKLGCQLLLLRARWHYMLLASLVHAEKSAIECPTP